MRGGGEGVLDDDVRVGESLIYVAPRQCQRLAADQVTAGVDRGGVGLQRHPRVCDEGQQLVLHSYQGQCIFGDILVIGGHRRNLVADEPDLGVQDRHVGRDAALGGVALGYVKGGKYRSNACKLFSLAGVHGDDPGVRVRTSKYPAVEHPR